VNMRKMLAVAVILGLGLVAGFFILKKEPPVNADPHGHGANEAHAESGRVEKGADQKAQDDHKDHPADKDDSHDQPGHKDENGHGEESEAVKGPNGGRLMPDGNFAVEVAIFEQGMPPEFRVYAFENNKPIDPAAVKLQVELSRLGAEPQVINFTKQQDYLRGDKEIEEPHSFVVRVNAQYQGKSHEWEYEQVEARVTVSDAAAKTAGIEIKTAGPGKIRSALELPGEIQFNQDRLAHVVPRLAGVVAQSLKNLGDNVRKGEVLAVLESQTLADLRSEYFAAQKRVAMTETTFKREKQLWEEKISAEQDYLASRQALGEAQIALRNAQQKLLALGIPRASIARGGADGLTRYEVRAPQDGTVIEKHLSVGEAVKEDADVFVIADLSTVWAEITVYPKDLNLVKLGQKVTVKASGLDAEASGEIAYVGALVGEQTRSAKARGTLQNPDRSWRPGLFVTVSLIQSDAQVPVAVPVDAIQTVRDWKVVFGRFGDVFEARPVELGRSDGKWVEVKSGLTAGTQYAASNSFIIKADIGKAGASHDH
jgi:membrane fusion protein, heavy metal efflux system